MNIRKAGIACKNYYYPYIWLEYQWEHANTTALLCQSVCMQDLKPITCLYMADQLTPLWYH